MAQATPQGDSNVIDDLFQQAEAAFSSAWDLVTAYAPNLHSLPEDIHQSMATMYSKITQQGTLPTSWKDLPVQWASNEPVALPPPPPPPTLTGTASNYVTKHPFLFIFASTGLGFGTSYYFAPHATIKALQPIIKPVKNWIPLFLLPKSTRPAKLITQQGELRKEAVLVLGAEGLGRELALDLEEKGFVVIATVSQAFEVDRLEKSSRGWMKVLVLDPTESSSVGPFLRSLSQALNLRFPLYSSGDPFARPSHALALTSLVNALSLTQQMTSLTPIEAQHSEQVFAQVGERVSTLVGVLNGILPIMKTAASRPGAAEGIILSLLPANSLNISLPFNSLESAASAAVNSILHSLRRELKATKTSNLKITTLEIGFFETPAPTAAQTQTEPLPLRLSHYTIALATRRFAQTQTSRPKSDPRKLYKKVFSLLTNGRSGIRDSVGAGAISYWWTSWCPNYVIDVLLSLQDRLTSLYLWQRSRNLPQPPGEQTARGSRPLPIPPSLQPGNAPQRSQIPIEPFSRTSGQPQPPTRLFDAQETESSGEEESSIEDFGPLGESGMGSFVDVSGKWRE